jgi:hypothetical protein
VSGCRHLPGTPGEHFGIRPKALASRPLQTVIPLGAEPTHHGKPVSWNPPHSIQLAFDLSDVSMAASFAVGTYGVSNPIKLPTLRCASQENHLEHEPCTAGCLIPHGKRPTSPTNLTLHRLGEPLPTPTS